MPTKRARQASLAPLYLVGQGFGPESVPMSLCHAGQLLQWDCRVGTDDTNNTEVQRVRRRHSCASCLDRFKNSELQVPSSRCRVLTAEVGHISSSRTFFVRWTILGVLDVEVKAFQLASSSHRLLVFRSAEDATAAAGSVSQLVPIDGETVGFRLCNNAKTFCPSVNFAGGAHCLNHIGSRSGLGRSGTAEQSQTLHLALQTLPGPETDAGPVAGGSTKRPWEASPSSEDSASTTAGISHHLGAPLGSEPLDTAIDSFLGALISNYPPSDPPLTSGNLEELPSNPVGSADPTLACSSSSSDEARCSPGFDWLMQQEHQLGGGGSLLGGRCCATLPPSSSLTCCGACSTAMHCAPITVHVGGGDVEQQAGRAQASLSNGMRASSSRQHGTSVPTLNVEGQLYVAGETLKASGSSAWTVVSDARVKEVMNRRTAPARRCTARAAPHPPRCTTPACTPATLHHTRGDEPLHRTRCKPPLSVAERDHLIAGQVVATFDLGMGELLQLNPKIFRYNGLGGTDRSGKLHVGLLAQDVPNKLATFCRKRTLVKLHSGDAELTEIFILDHSCIPFVCINAIKKHEEQIDSFRMRVRRWKQCWCGQDEPQQRSNRGRPRVCAAWVCVCHCWIRCPTPFPTQAVALHGGRGGGEQPSPRLRRWRLFRH